MKRVLVLLLVLVLAGCGNGKNRKGSPGITHGNTSSIPAQGQTAPRTTTGG